MSCGVVSSTQAPKAAQKAGVTLTAPMLKALSARAIGPAVMGGRISEIAFDPRIRGRSMSRPVMAG